MCTYVYAHMSILPLMIFSLTLSFLPSLFSLSLVVLSSLSCTLSCALAQASPINIDLLVQMSEATLNAERGAWLSAGLLFDCLCACVCLCMTVFVCLCLCVSMCAHPHAHVRARTHARTHTHTHTHSQAPPRRTSIKRRREKTTTRRRNQNRTLELALSSKMKNEH